MSFDSEDHPAPLALGCAIAPRLSLVSGRDQQVDVALQEAGTMTLLAWHPHPTPE